MTKAPLPPDKKLTGFYVARPEETLRLGVSIALQAAGVLAADPKRSHALHSIVYDEALTRRAAGLIIRSMLHQLQRATAPEPRDLTRLVDHLVALAREV